MKRLTCIVLAATALGCGSDAASRLVTSSYADGSPWSEGRIVDGRADGVWRTWHPNGQLASEGSYDRGLEDGRWVEYAADGTLLAERNYDQGQLVGPWLRCNPDGTPESRGTFVNGRREGPWYDHHTNGALRSSGDFEAGRRQGRWLSMAPDGTLLALQEFDADVLDGATARWTESGRLLSLGEYTDGEPSGTWWTFFVDRAGSADEGGGPPPSPLRPDGGVDLVPGGPIQTVSQRLDDGAIELTSLLPGGRVAFRGRLVDDRRDGVWRFWGADGALDEQLSGVYSGEERVSELPPYAYREAPSVPTPPAELPR